MTYGTGPGVVRGTNGRYHQMTCAKIPSRGAKKAKVHHEVSRKCAQEGCISKVSIYTAGRFCNIHAGQLSIKEATKELRGTVPATERQRMASRRNAMKARVGKRYKMTAWAKRQRDKI